MSITNETVKKHLKNPAILCCQRPKGTIISAADLEDPSLFEDMEEAGLLELSPEGLTIEQVLGATLVNNTDALTPILPAMLDKVNEVAVKPEIAPKAQTSPIKQEYYGGEQMIHLEIAKLEGLKLDIPRGMLIPEAGAIVPLEGQFSEKIEDKVIRTLTKKYFAVKEVVIGEKTSFENGVITIEEGIVAKALEADDLIKDIKLDIIKPDQRHVYTDTIMDVCPIATKVEGALGEGITHVVEGAVFMLTGVDEDGVQIHEFGSSEGFLDERMAFGNPGCADQNDIIIRVATKLERLTGMERRGPFAAHKCQDVIIQAIRDVLKEAADAPSKEEICQDIQKLGRPRVVLVKEIMGQGAMHDNVLCPSEPCGVHGGQKERRLG